MTRRHPYRVAAWPATIAAAAVTAWVIRTLEPAPAGAVVLAAVLMAAYLAAMLLAVDRAEHRRMTAWLNSPDYLQLHYGVRDRPGQSAEVQAAVAAEHDRKMVAAAAFILEARTVAHTRREKRTREEIERARAAKAAELLAALGERGTRPGQPGFLPEVARLMAEMAERERHDVGHGPPP
jgi:hypothetical protein